MSEGDAVGLPVPVSVGVGLPVPVSVGVGLPVTLVVGVGLPVTVVVGVGLPVTLAVGETHAVVVATGRADETAAAIRSLDPVGVRLTAAGWHCDAAFQPGDAVLPGPIGLAPAVLCAPLVSVPLLPPFGVPWPSVPAPPDVWPPVSTLEVT